MEWGIAVNLWIAPNQARRILAFSWRGRQFGRASNGSGKARARLAAYSWQHLDPEPDRGGATMHARTACKPTQTHND